MTRSPACETADELRERLRDHAYLADRRLAMVLLLALRLRRPLLLEGDAGVGKTEVAKVLAEVLGSELVRLQCYEGIDASQALFEWDYPRQLLHLRALEAQGSKVADVENQLYDERFLLARPLLQALRLGGRAVLLIDEVDRADAEFEAFLLELLSDYQVTVPELGIIRAAEPPVVILTSNRTRELHDALKRRCLYHWIDHPEPQREAAILRARAPEVSQLLAEQVAGVVGRLRQVGLFKPPGVAEAIDWARALASLELETLDRAVAEDTLGLLIKDHEDLHAVRATFDEIVRD